MKTNLSNKTITVKANNALNVSVSGQYFFCTSSSAPILMSIDGGEQVTIVQGVAFPTSEPFRNLIFQNTTAADITITFFTGSNNISYFPPQTNVIQSNAATYAKGSGDINLAAGASQAFTGLDGVKVRKQIVFTNLNAGPGNSLIICDGNGN